MKPQIKFDFAVFTHYVKGLVFTGAVLEHSGIPYMKNEWKMMFKRLMQAANGYEKALSKGLGTERSEAEDQTNSEIYAHVYKILSMEGKDLDDYLKHCNQWKA